MFSHTEILEEFVEAARTVRDLTADYSARSYLDLYISTYQRKWNSRHDPWNMRRERQRELELRKDPAVMRARCDYAIAYYHKNKEKLLKRRHELKEQKAIRG